MKSLQTLRRWRDLIGCRVYGHHWSCSTGNHTEPNDDGTMDVFLEINYGECKRCGAMPEDPNIYDAAVLNISVMDYKIEATRAAVDVSIQHEVKIVPMDHDLIKSRTYVRKAVKK